MSVSTFLPAAGKIGPTEILIIVLIIVVLFGPKLLPKLGQTFGDTIRSFKEGVAPDKDSDKKDKDDVKDI